MLGARPAAIVRVHIAAIIVAVDVAEARVAAVVVVAAAAREERKRKIRCPYTACSHIHYLLFTD